MPETGENQSHRKKREKVKSKMADSDSFSSSFPSLPYSPTLGKISDGFSNNNKAESLAQK